MVKKMISDPIADLLIRIKNASMAGSKNVSVPYSKLKENLAKILQVEGYLKKVAVSGEGVQKELVLTLAEEGSKPRPIEVKRISKPGGRVYVQAKEIKLWRRGLGTVIISTPKGLMTGKQALQKKLGGEIICKVI